MSDTKTLPGLSALPDAAGPLGTPRARIEERILQPLRTTGAFARRTWFSVTLAAIVALYAALLGWMLWRDAADPPKAAPAAAETPVEVVAEMPKPPAPPTPPAPPQEAEKPATSAPRAFNDATIDDDRADKETRAPRKAAPPAEARPAQQASKDATQDPPHDDAKPDAKPDDKADAPKPPDVLEKDAEALDKLPPEPPKKPAALAKAPPVPPKPPRRAKSAADQLAGTSELPDYTFAKPMRKHAKVSGGSEDDRYLAVVYGMITQYRRAISAPAGEWAVAVSFVIDGGGNLVGIQVSRSSGYPEIDAAAVQSVEEAAPFPPPPSGGRTGLVARLRSLDAVAGDR